jgi:hypothetical protein
LAGAEIPPGGSEEEAVALKEAVAESFVSGFRLVTLISAALSLACGVIALLILESRKPEAPEGMTIMSRGSG